MTNQCLDKTNAFVWNTETIHGINLIINPMTLLAVWLVVGITSVKLCIIIIITLIAV